MDSPLLMMWCDQILSPPRMLISIFSKNGSKYSPSSSNCPPLTVRHNGKGAKGAQGRDLSLSFLCSLPSRRSEPHCPHLQAEKAKKDPNAPKKPLAAYMLFCKARHEVGGLAQRLKRLGFERQETGPRAAAHSLAPLAACRTCAPW